MAKVPLKRRECKDKLSNQGSGYIWGKKPQILKKKGIKNIQRKQQAEFAKSAVAAVAIATLNQNPVAYRCKKQRWQPGR